MKEYVKIFTGSSIIINRLAQLLEDVKIASFTKDHKESGRLAGFGTTGDSVELFIYDSDLEDAKNIIKNFQKEIEK